MRISDIAKAVSEDANLNLVGIRPGEKLHEQMIGLEDAPHTFDYGSYYKILPAIHNWSADSARIGHGIKVRDDFSYNSETNDQWMSIESLREWISANSEYLGRI